MKSDIDFIGVSSNTKFQNNNAKVLIELNDHIIFRSCKI